MATHKSAAKRARQDLRRSAVNQKKLSAIRTLEKKIRTAAAAGDVKNAQTFLSEFTGVITRAGVKGLMHAKAASRRVARLAYGIDNKTLMSKTSAKTAAKTADKKA